MCGLRNLIKKTISALFVVAIASGSTFGDGVYGTGDPILGNSWGATFGYGTGGYDLDCIAVKLVSGSPQSFESPTLRSMSNGWTTTGELGGSSPYLAVASGAASTSGFSWTIWFDGLPSSSVAFDIVSFDTSNVEHFSQRITWNTSSWSISSAGSGPWHPDRSLLPTSIPLPMPAFLAGIGLLGAIPVRRRLLRMA